MLKKVLVGLSLLIALCAFTILIFAATSPVSTTVDNFILTNLRKRYVRYEQDGSHLLLLPLRGAQEDPR